MTPPHFDGHPILVTDNIHKHFPGVHALRGVSLELFPGQILGLVGENGAGKSTLIKALAGVHTPDAGEIRIDGRPVQIRSPQHAQQLGIGVIYQEFNLVPTLSARENIFLGQEETTASFFSPSKEYKQACELLERLEMKFDPERLCSQLTVAQQQGTEIAKAIRAKGRILILDEPTATLTQRETRRLFSIVRNLRDRHLAIIYISHRLEEIFELADTVMVMRDGSHVDTQPVDKLDRKMLIEKMVGRTIENEFPKIRHSKGPERLVVENLTRTPAVRNVSFAVRAGEVLGFAGLVGAGRTETMRLIFGADKAQSGRIFLDGKAIHVRHPREAIRNRICLLTEDRKTQGLVLKLSVRENFGLPNLKRFARLGFINRKEEKKDFERYVDQLRIKIAHSEVLVENLSGGNQQKVVLAKWLESNSDVIIFDEPTRGIDVGAKYEIYQLINELAGQGKVILMVSSELPELLGMSDRIVVMHEGRITGVIEDVAHADQEDILSLAVKCLESAESQLQELK